MHVFTYNPIGVNVKIDQLALKPFGAKSPVQTQLVRKERSHDEPTSTRHVASGAQFSHASINERVTGAAVLPRFIVHFGP
jgi:hypothetical protein